MGFRTIVVNEHSKLAYKNNHLTYKSANQQEVIALCEIDLLILETTDITITTALISKLSESNIAMVFCDQKRLPTAQLLPYYGKHDSSLQLQNQVNWTSGCKAQAWFHILAQKIDNQSQFLYAFAFEEKGQAIVDLLTTLQPGDPSNREGHASRIFFNTLYGNNFSREKVNDINAALDYGYTMIMSLFAREIVKCGCVTQLGINHTNQFNPFNLASDLMEPFRILVDEIVYSYKDHSFPVIKRHLFALFNKTYDYNGSQMYLTNIVSHYVKACIDYLHESQEKMPRFTWVKG